MKFKKGDYFRCKLSRINIVGRIVISKGSFYYYDVIWGDEDLHYIRNFSVNSDMERKSYKISENEALAWCI